MDLVDTNILSELSRRRPSRAVLSWIGERTEISVSAVTIEEIHFGLSAHPNPRVLALFTAFVEAHCQVLPVTHEIARLAGELRGRFRAKGEQRTQADMLIAATARAHGLRLATRNVRDFAGCGVGLLNPFA
jgi:predicted nucleic acid-binding protein